MSFPLSVLDYTPITHGGTGVEAFAESLALAQLAEELGYYRFWVAEHHNMRGIAGVAPEILIGVVAQHTERIRIGSGAVLLPNYAPLKVAGLFRTLEALAPGRIDAGIGRAPYMDPRSALALRGPDGDPNAANDIARLVAELEGFAGIAPPGVPSDHPLYGVVAEPADVPFPPIFLLGSGQLSAQIAAARGHGFASASFFGFPESEKAIHAYKANFQPSAAFPRPYAILTASVICADTLEFAEGLDLAGKLTALRRQNGESRGPATIEEGRAYQFTDEDLEKIKQFKPLVGTPDSLREELSSLVEQTRADELLLSVFINDPALRQRAYRLLAEAFELTAVPIQA
jgi:luciferase family oxidoreductase group 1